MTQPQDPGARWLRCDLHVHTPFDSGKKFGEDIKGAIEAFRRERPQKLAEIASRFIETCRQGASGTGIDLVALTDHNSIDGYRYLKPQFDSIAQQARDAGILMPVVLPGVEFSVGGERPIHFLAIFASGTPADDVDTAIRFVFGEREPFDPNSGTPRATGESIGTFLERLYKFCRPPTGERELHFVLLPAHADSRVGVGRETGATSVAVATTLWDEMKGQLRQWAVARTDWNGFESASPYGRLPQAFQDLLLRWAAAKRGEDWDTLTGTRKDRYREQRHWQLVECSDPHGYEEIGSHYTWLKMELPDVEGIRLALLDPESRLRRMADGPPARSYPRLNRILARQTDFFEDVEIPLNPCLTTLIGGRGSGKSTVVEYIRYALDRAHNEDFSGDGEDDVRTTADALLSRKPDRDFGETRGTLLPDHEIEVDLTVAGRLYRLRRTAGQIEVTPDPDRLGAVPAPLDIRTLVLPRILSQRQIARIARDPAAQRRELDALLGAEWLREFAHRRRKLLDRLAGLQLTRTTLKDRAKTLPARETELQKVNDQIAFLEEGGRRDTFERFQAYQREQNWIEQVRHELETTATALEEQAASVETAPDRLVPQPQGPTLDWTASIGARVEASMKLAAAALRTQASTLRSLLEAIAAEQAERWKPGFDEAQRDYHAVRQTMQDKGVDFSQHEKLLQQRVLLEREIRELHELDREIERVELQLREGRNELAHLHEERLARRRERARALEDADADVRLEILSFQDRQDLNSRREEWFGAAGLRERDWDILVEYVRAPGGSVPSRLGDLVATVRRDVEATRLAGRPIDPGSSSVATLLGTDRAHGLTGHFYNALQKGDRIRLDEMERFLPEDAVEARVRGADRIFKPISQGSIGQRSTAVLSLLLSSGDQPLVIDQPEDDLDNQYIYDVVVHLLRKRKFSRQIIIATHNANIPVNGDAELIVALGVNERLGVLLEKGSMDSEAVKEQVSLIMEGSAEAFRLRRERYGY
jgi:predicted metal-dependent phosphoesterase TrpH/ABC-type lipoprotein export system ATPase subunit